MRLATLLCLMIACFVGHGCISTRSHVYTGIGAVRQLQQGYPLPPVPRNASHVYFYVDGFQDHTWYIAFTAPKEDCDQIVAAFLGTGLDLFMPLRDIEPLKRVSLGKPQPCVFLDRDYSTPEYDLSNLQDPTFIVFRHDRTKGKSDCGYFIYDRAPSRLYFSMNTF